MAEEVEGQAPPAGDQSGDVEAKIRKVLGEMLGAHEVEVDDTEDDAAKAKPKGRRSVADQEDDIAARVKAEVERVKHEDAHRAEHDRLKAEADKPTSPQVPTKRGKGSTFFWGE